MSDIKTKKIALMASHDWTLRRAFAEFLEFLNPVFRWEGREYRLELIRVIAKPLVAGEDLSKRADLIVDRTTHWNPYYRYWAHQAMNSMARMVNHSYTFSVFDKHSTYDLMARAIHPSDRFPKTVILPQFQPWTEDQKKQHWWAYEQQLIIENTQFGFDPTRRTTDWDAVKKKLEEDQRYDQRARVVREHFYEPGNYIEEVVSTVFNNKFPLYLKKAYGGGGSKVYKVNNLQELCDRYDKTGDEAFHLQEAIEPYERFYRAMGVGPIVFPMIFQPDKPHHEHYSPEKVRIDREVFHRLQSYIMFINSYHRWTYNSFECLYQDGKLHPIDFANACPDSQFLSLHVHFPLLVISLLKWLAFCSITEKDMRIDLEMTRYLKVLNNPEIPQEEKFNFCRKCSEEYFEISKFEDFCGANFEGIEDRMIEFYDTKFDEIIRFSLEFSNFKESEIDHFYGHYRGFMDNLWRPRAKEYMTPVVYS
jgi:hypothetical protein